MNYRKTMGLVLALGLISDYDTLRYSGYCPYKVRKGYKPRFEPTVLSKKQCKKLGVK